MALPVILKINLVEERLFIGSGSAGASDPAANEPFHRHELRVSVFSVPPPSVPSLLPFASSTVAVMNFMTSEKSFCMIEKIALRILELDISNSKLPNTPQVWQGV